MDLQVFETLLLQTRCRDRNHDNYRLSRLWFLETPDFLSSEYSLSIDTVTKVVSVIQRVVECIQLFGLCEMPQTEPEFKEFLRFRCAGKLHKRNVKILMFCFYKQVHKFLSAVAHWGEDSWVPLWKWKFAAFFSFYRSQEIPPLPFIARNKRDRKLLDPSYLLGGIVHDWCGLLRRYDQDAFWTLVDTVLQLKKCMPPVSEVMVRESIMKTVDRLTSERIDVEPSEEDVFEFTALEAGFFNKRSLMCELDRTTFELFRHQRLPWTSVTEPFFPSTSANYTHSRGKGGAVTEVFSNWDVLKTQDPRGDDCESLLIKSLINVQVNNIKSEKYGDTGAFENRVTEVQKDILGEYPSELELCLTLDDTDFRTRWCNFYWSQWKTAINENPFVSPIGLAEPLKVRVITKGPAYLYTVLKPIQKFLWRVLKEHPCFNLIGRYVDPSDIESLYERFVDHYEDDQLHKELPYELIRDHGFKFLSGDYKDSTNEIRSWASNVVVMRLVECLKNNATEEDLINLPNGFFETLNTFMRTALTGHIVDFSGFVTDPNDLENLKLLPQKEGQLMGSIVSFPILCIVNFALCQYSQKLDMLEFHYNHTPEESRVDLERYRTFLAERSLFGFTYCEVPSHYPFRFGSARNVGVHNPALTVNGDDCLLFGSSNLKRIWELVGKGFGLSSSMGKTYWSNEFCTINSSNFSLNWVHLSRSFVLIVHERKFVNMGLVHGMKRSVASVNDNNKQPAGNLGNLLRELKRSTPVRVWPAVKAMFISINRENLKKFSEVGLPWFLPEWLGGAGLPRDEEKISRDDRFIASIIRSKFADRIKTARLAVPWDIHDKVIRQLRSDGLSPSLAVNYSDGTSIMDSWNSAYKILVLDILFTNNISTLILNGKDTVDGHLKHNARIWQKSRELLGRSHLEPLSDEEIIYESRKLPYVVRLGHNKVAQVL